MPPQFGIIKQAQKVGKQAEAEQVGHATNYSWLRMYRPIRNGCAFKRFGFTQLFFFNIGSPEVGTTEVGSAKFGTCEEGTAEVGSAEISTTEFDIALQLHLIRDMWSWSQFGV